MVNKFNSRTPSPIRQNQGPSKVKYLGRAVQPMVSSYKIGPTRSFSTARAVQMGSFVNSVTYELSSRFLAFKTRNLPSFNDQVKRFSALMTMPSFGSRPNVMA